MTDARIVTVETTATKIDQEKFANDGASADDWLMGELAWGVGMFLRVGFTIALSRLFWVLVNDLKLVSPEVMDYGDEILSFTKKPDTGSKPYERAGSSWSAAYGKEEETRRQAGFTNDRSYEERPSDMRQRVAARAQALDIGTYRYLAQVGDHPVVHHGTRLPEQTWPCPLLLESPCGSCYFRVKQRSGTVDCAAVEKLRQLLDGRDDGRDLHELRAKMLDS